jgi:hypothetical protein
MARIVNTDNFDSDYPDEEFVTGLPRLSEAKLQMLCKVINDLNDPGDGSQARYYKVVPDDYKLQPGFEP